MLCMWTQGRGKGCENRKIVVFSMVPKLRCFLYRKQLNSEYITWDITTWSSVNRPVNTLHHSAEFTQLWWGFKIYIQRDCRIQHRKWRDTKLQTSRPRPGSALCSSISGVESYVVTRIVSHRHRRRAQQILQVVGRFPNEAVKNSDARIYRVICHVICHVIMPA